MDQAVAEKLQLVIVQIACDLIDPNPWNPNRMNEVVEQAERESIERFGFVDPVTVRNHPEAEGRYQIIDGEHRWRIASEAGYTEIPAVILDVTDDEAKKLTIVLNETRGEADVVLLGQLLSDLKDLDDFGTALPFSRGELDHLLSIGAEDWDNFGRDDTADPPPPLDVVEVVLYIKTKQHKAFLGWIEILRKEWELPDAEVTDLVVEAVKRAAVAANQG